MTKELTTFIEKSKTYKRVWLYGAGNYGKRMKLFLEQNGLKVEAFLLTQKTVEDSEFRSVPIYAIEDVDIKDEDLVIICTSESAHEEIKCWLSEKQVKNIFPMDKLIYEQIKNELSYQAVKDVPNGKYIQVLLFHRVINKPNDPWGLEIRPETFEQYIKYISQNYNVKRFDEDWTDVSEKTIIITFDDGYWDNLEYALPILEKYKVPATVFVSTGNLDTTDEFWWDRLARLVAEDKLIHVRNELRKLSPVEREEAIDKIEHEGNSVREKSIYDRTLSTDELKRLSDSKYITIGGHTVNHNALIYQSEDEQRFEISHSKKVIEDIIGKEITTFSYPFGQKDTYSDTTIKLLKECGLKRAASTEQKLVGRNPSPYEIPRIGQPEIELKAFVRKIEEKWYMEG